MRVKLLYMKQLTALKSAATSRSFSILSSNSWWETCSSGNRTRSVRPGGKHRSIRHTKISEIQMERAQCFLGNMRAPWMQSRSQSPCVFWSWSAPCFLVLLTFIETDLPEFSPRPGLSPRPITSNWSRLLFIFKKWSHSVFPETPPVSISNTLWTRSLSNATRYAASQNLYKSRVTTNTGKQTIFYIASIFWHNITSYLKSLNVYQFSEQLEISMN